MDPSGPRSSVSQQSAAVHPPRNPHSLWDASVGRSPPSSSTSPNTSLTAAYLQPPPTAISHTRAYLEALVATAHSRRNVPLRSVSSLNSSYKPQKPSSLASSASATGSSEGNGNTPPTDSSSSSEDEEGVEVANLVEINSAGAPSSRKSSVGNLQSPLFPSTPLSPGEQQQAAQQQQAGLEAIAGVILLLDDSDLAEEETIDQVRNKLGNWLEEAEGVKPSPSRLDSIVLDVMHRHREDLEPTGATFPTSPLHRPASTRSYSTQGGSRPWTPSKLPITPSRSSAGFADAFATVSGGTATAPSMTPGLSSSAFLGGERVIKPPSRSGSPAPGRDPGVIGSGSPRGSPRLRNAPLTPLRISSTRDSFASGSNPWGGPSGPPTPSCLSSAFPPTLPTSPLSSVPPGLSASLAVEAVTSGSSRPTSPSPFASPRMNVAAVAFKPRTASSSSIQSPALSAVRPSILDSGRRPSSSSFTQAMLSKNHPTGAEDEDEDDEFSPFGAAVKADATPGGSAGSFYSSSATSSSGGFDGRAAAAGVGTASGGEEDEWAAGGGMTPYDVLLSVLSGSAGASGGGTKWSSDQIEEALAVHNWDVDATLASIFESGGQPISSSMRTLGVSGTPPIGRSPLLGHQQVPTGPRTSGGVSIMPREAFSSLRGGRTSSYTGINRVATPPVGRGTGAISPSLPGGGGGGVGPGRVCRYFLSGDCRRADCRFSHDLSKALCKFWLRGHCLNDPCPFLHDSDVLQALAGGMSASSLYGGDNGAESPLLGDDESGLATPPLGPSIVHHASDDFPELVPSGPKAQRVRQQHQNQAGSGSPPLSSSLVASSSGPPPGAPTGPAASDPTRTRWATALQRPKAPTPLALIQQQALAASGNGLSTGEAVKLIHVAGARGAPSRPAMGLRSISSTSLHSQSGSNHKALAARLVLRAPTLLPTLATGKGSASTYSLHRSALAPLIEQRNRCLARASEAFRAGDGSAARKFSAEGQSLNARIKEANHSAARDLLKERHQELSERLRSPGSEGGGWGSNGNASMDEVGTRGLRGKLIGGGLGVCLGVARKEALPPSSTASSSTSTSRELSVEERTECLLDCHGLHASEAVEVVEEFLLALERESHQGLTYLAVGNSKHTNTATDRRRVGLAGPVKSFLAAWGYPYAEIDGVLVVDQLIHWS